MTALIVIACILAYILIGAYIGGLVYGYWESKHDEFDAAMIAFFTGIGWPIAPFVFGFVWFIKRVVALGASKTGGM